MPTIQIRDVPEEATRILKVRAAASGKSLQAYLRAELVAQASRPTVAEWVDSLGPAGGSTATTEEIVALVRADRDAR